jgi:hypothetical protein
MGLLPTEFVLAPDGTMFVNTESLNQSQHGDRRTFSGYSLTPDELLLLLRASPRYQKAALVLLRQAIAARDAGENEYAELVVHFALSRMRTDGAGRVTMAQLRDELRHLPHSGTLLPALRRLEEQGVVVLIVEKSGDPMTELLRSPITHVELRMPW